MYQMLASMIRKEFLQLRRDRRMFPILILAPLVQLIILGFAVNFDVDHIPTAVLDNDRSAESRDFLDHFFASGYFERRLEMTTRDEIDPALDRGGVQVVLVVPPQFGQMLQRGDAAKVQLLVNGSDPTYATNGFTYAVQTVARYSSTLLLERMDRTGVTTLPGVDLRQRIWYNPELKTRWFMVPAILGLILMVITMMLTAMALVREKEQGTIEMLVVTPLRRLPLLAGKLIPFLLIGLLEVTLIVLAAIFIFGIPLRGAAWLLFLGSLLFLFNTLGLGLLVSTLSHTQQQAVMAAIFIVMMPFIYLSGFVFPIDAMPSFFQHLSKAIALTYYLEIVRAVFLKGSGITLLAKDFIALTLLGVVTFTLPVVRFKKYI